MKSRAILFGLSFFIWLILSWSADAEHIIAGFLCSFLVAWITGGIFTGHPYKFKGINRFVKFFFHYIPVFIWECLKANIDVAIRVMHPDILIKPGIVKVRTTLKSDTAITFLANSITLTPGTLVIDLDRKNGFLYVHWVNVKATDIDEATKLIVDRFEKILKGVFE